MNGGQIRNAAQQATLLALDEATGLDVSDGGDADNRMRRAPDDVAVRDEHVVAAVREEYQKDGAVCPLTIQENEGPSSGAQQFVEGMTS
jgi:hypothetical protein